MATRKSNTDLSLYAAMRDSSATLQHAIEDGESLGTKESDSESRGRKIVKGLGLFCAFLFCLWVFLVGLKIMGDAFKTLAGCEAGTLFTFIDNPIAGLMVGVLATILVQSSSTSTSIVVSMVGSGALSVSQAIPIIMGANIGTTITSTLVACGQIGDKVQFERAFSAATVHDMFNILSVVVFLPIEVIGEPLQRISSAIVNLTESKKGTKTASPVDGLVKPISSWLLQVNKNVIKEAAKGDKKGYCASVKSILKGGVFYENNVSDKIAGSVSLVISLILVVFALLAIVKLLNILLLSAAEKSIKKALRLNGYFMMIVGAALTFLVQSSSIVTSVLTPLVGVDMIQLEQMYPMVLGANLGTTGTAFIASLVSGKDEAVQIAICHLFFNVFGILVWYPVPFMRGFPLQLARGMGYVASKLVWFPLVYIITLFVCVPGIFLGISLLFSHASTLALVFGIVLTVVLLVLLLLALVWFYKYDGLPKCKRWIERHAAST